jgi:hypothetical protein
MRIEQEYAQVRPHLHGLVQNVRDAGRFADAGRTKHGEMLVQHLVDFDTGVDRDVLLQAADTDRGGTVFVEDDAQLFI